MLAVISLNVPLRAQATPFPKKDIYHDGWTDRQQKRAKRCLRGFTKQTLRHASKIFSRSDEDLDEKTCQTATLYGFNRVLTDRTADAGMENAYLEGRDRQHRRASERRLKRFG